MLSTLVKGSCSVCDVPILYLNSLWPNYWEQFKKCIFKGMDDEEIISKFGYRLNVIELMKREKYIPKSILVLDCSVDRDFELQYTPFFKDLQKIPFTGNNDNIKIMVNGKFKGHGPLGMYETLHLVKISKFIFNSEDYKFTSDKEYNELLELRKFKKDILNIFNSQINSEIEEILDMDFRYEKMYNDLVNKINLSDYNFNLKSFTKIKNTPLFDAKWYINNYNLNISEKYALLHYLDKGFKEGKNPCSDFYGDEYLEVNYDVKKAGMNPLVHYELYGKREGRQLPFFKI